VGEKLSSPPLIEAICEFRLAAGEDWDGTLPGRLFDRISSEFPERTQVRQVGVHVELHGDGDSQAHITQASDRVQLKRSDGSAMVQIGPNLFAVNHLRPYPSWDDFRALILRQLDEYLPLLSDVPPLSRLGLRYINRLQLPHEGCDLGDFTTLAPPLEGMLDRPLLGFYQRYQLLYETPPGPLSRLGCHRAGWG
jgi:uncharacterized protein (TIGR04255 family)